MIKIPIDRDLSLEASLRAEKIPLNINNSITDGKNRFIGCLGEVALVKYLKSKSSDVSYIGDYEFDVMSNGKRLEVKTKKCAGEPKPHYECSVSDYNSGQKCDYYVFTRCSPQFIYLCGFIPVDVFKERARFVKSGETDSNMFEGKNFTFKCDCYNIRIDELYGFII